MKQMNRRQRRCRARCRRTSQAKARVAVVAGGPPSPCWLTRLFAGILSEVRDGARPILLGAAACLHECKRPGEWWGSVLMLMVTVVSAAFTAYAAFRPPPSVAGLSFKTGVSEGSGGLHSFATPEPGDTLSIRLQLTPHHQDLGGVAVTISGSPRVELTDRCYYRVGESQRSDCAMPAGEGRIDLARLNSGETLWLAVEARVLSPIEDRERITIEMSSAEVDSSRREIDIFSPQRSEGTLPRPR